MVEKVSKVKALIADHFPEIDDVNEELASLAFRRAKPKTQLASAFKMMQSVNAQDPNSAASLNPLQAMRNYIHGQMGSFVSVGKYVIAPSVVTDSGNRLTSFNRFDQWEPVPIATMAEDMELLEMKLQYCRENKVAPTAWEESFKEAEEVPRDEVTSDHVAVNYEFGELRVEANPGKVAFDTGKLICAVLDP